ncbi:MAG: hypothetical protein AB7E04_00765 [Desulfobacteraceae bacterium]
MLSKIRSNKNSIVQEDIFADYIYVMVSTLNQMVNYIPLGIYKFKEIYNITTSGSKYSKNKKWDENLQKILIKEKIISAPLGEKYTLSFEQELISDVSKMEDCLAENFEGQKVFWNVTGGQRSVAFAINKISGPEDVVCYLEGNKNKIVLQRNNFENFDIVENYTTKELLKIETALELMGFEIKDTKTSQRKLLENLESNETKIREKKFYIKLLEEFINDRFFRLQVVDFNIKNNKNAVKETIFEKMNGLTYDNFENDFNKEYPLGYILEKLAGYKIYDVAKNKIADLSFSEKINFNDKHEKVTESAIDEFDIALLTRNGKFMIFECKSGAMSGDIAKSTKYSTYAVSGAYGLPILITPLTQEEINDVGEFNKLLKEGCYKNIKKSVLAAKRASLEVWGIDKIEERLNHYLDN